jgi:hypothetical protein
MVMLNGRLYDAATLDETVTGDRKTRPFFWQKASTSTSDSRL